MVLFAQGARPRLPLQVQSLPETKISSATAAREARAVAAFQTWLINLEIRVSLSVLVELGRSLYDSDGPYSGFVYATTGLQTLNLRLKRNLPCSWDFAFIWRSLEPVVHRRPVDEALVLAMVGVGAGFGVGFDFVRVCC